ncbi:RNF133_1 [Blepharisma stoltei]|uniref:RING-type domain-containing protein n=1 Tax=Blepharisma stoltei TaxID=1481888 RepID=A0AAU9J0L9_9CILI|nr:unnamed protein product [Blepharisma stoltei]
MSEIYFPTQLQHPQPQSRSSIRFFNILYSAYTIAKIGCIIGVLSADGSKCPGLLYVYLLILAATEVYELVFFLLLSLHRYCMHVNISSFFIRTGQISYECFRLLITAALAAEVYKEPSVIRYASGIFSLILIMTGFLKYVIIVLIGIPYLFFYRRIFDESNNSRLQTVDGTHVSEHELDEYIGPMPQGEICSICYEETNSSSPWIVLRCKHGFHRHCLKYWVLIKGSCPVCRTPIKED